MPRGVPVEPLRDALEALYAHYTRAEYIDPDPVGIVRRYPDDDDREVVALLAASLAYGRVRHILNSLERVLSVLGPRPAARVDAMTPSELRRRTQGIQHRWTRGEDLAELLIGIRAVRRRYGSLHAAFVDQLSPDAGSINAALSAWVGTMRGSSGGACRLLSDPAAGSACKRLHLFLKWVIRKDAVDPGGWNGIPWSLLMMPVDTHIHRVGLALGFTRRKQADARTVIEVTEGFRRVAPHDPTRYDFALTRPGIRDGVDLRTLGRDPVSALRRLLPSDPHSQV